MKYLYSLPFVILNVTSTDKYLKYVNGPGIYTNEMYKDGIDQPMIDKYRTVILNFPLLKL